MGHNCSSTLLSFHLHATNIHPTFDDKSNDVDDDDDANNDDIVWEEGIYFYSHFM